MANGIVFHVRSVFGLVLMYASQRSSARAHVFARACIDGADNADGGGGGGDIKITCRIRWCAPVASERLLITNAHTHTDTETDTHTVRYCSQCDIANMISLSNAGPSVGMGVV